MDITQFYARENEKPLDYLVEDGGFTKVFRTIACIGDSLSSGEFQSKDENGAPGYHDMFEYSWGQYIARAAGVKVLNFSRGGMTAHEYVSSYAASKGWWSEDLLCQGYIIALGVNDLNRAEHPLGSVSDINLKTKRNAETFAGFYGSIIQKIRTLQPKARFFLMTIPRSGNPEADAKREAHAKLLHEIADLFEFTYVLDFFQYAPVYDETFRRNFFLDGHMNPQGYILTAKMVMSYIDYIVRHNPDDFSQVPFIGKPYHNMGAKW